MPSSEPILVGVDGTERSDGALNMALDLARRLSCPLQLVHAVDAKHVRTDAEREAARQHVHTQLEARLSGARLAAGDSDFQLEVIAGHPAKVLVDRARELMAGLIVLGEHRRRSLLDLGSTAAPVFAHAPCPVWCQVGPARRMERLVVASDGSAESRAALAMACAWASAMELPVHVVSVFEPSDFMAIAGQPTVGPTYTIEGERDQQRAEFDALVAEHAEQAPELTSSFLEGSVLESLNALLQEHDVLFMGSHGHTGLSAVVLGSATRGMLRSASVPVVVTSGAVTREQARAWVF